MNATRIVYEAMGLNGALLLCGASKKAWYYTPSPRNVSPDPQVQEMIQKIGPARPTYGTRRMAAQVSRELNRPVNRKAIRRIFRRLGWSEPSRTKREIIRANKKPPRPKGPEPVLGVGHVLHMVRGGRLGLLLQRHRRLHQAVAGVRAGGPRHAPPCHNGGKRRDGRRQSRTARPDHMVDNGSQYTSREFRSSVAAPGITPEYIYVNTPEQNGHIESFHKTLKEYVWPREFADIREARGAMRAAFHGYNHTRIHSAPEYLTPSGFAERWQQDAEGSRPYCKQIMESEECA